MKLFTLLINFISSSYLFATVTSSCPALDTTVSSDRATADTIDTVIEIWNTNLSAYTKMINDLDSSGSAANFSEYATDVQSTSQFIDQFNCLLSLLPSDVVVPDIVLSQSITDFNDLMATIITSDRADNVDANALMNALVMTFCNEILPGSVAFWNAVRSKLFTFSETQNIDGPNVCPVDETVTKFPITGNLNFFP